MNIYDEIIDNKLLNRLLDDHMYRDIISTKTFKRLRNISFLGAIDYTSRNKKKHNRYSHSISVGTLAMHYATLMQLNEHETKHLVVTALLHDIGHGPLSHSMEPAFQKRFGISHHSMTNNIIKGESKLGDELYLILKNHQLDINYIIELLNGEVLNETSFALNNPINIDTVDGIIRSMSYAYSSRTKKSHLALLPKPKEIIEALVNKNKKILDEFWSLKHRVYSDIIHKQENLKADFIAFDFARNNTEITQDDFYLTDIVFKNKYKSIFEQLKSDKIKTVEYKKRFYYLDENKTQIQKNEDIYEIYKSKREPRVLTLLSYKAPRQQSTLF